MTPAQPKPLTWSEVPDAEKKRLADREKAQRSETKGRKLTVEPVSVEALWMLQRGVCGCSKRCGNLNPFAESGAPNQTVIGHIDGRDFSGGHTIDSVRLQIASCNQTDAGREATERASRRRAEMVQGYNLIAAKAKPKRKKQKPPNYVSPLSKEARRKALKRKADQDARRMGERERN